MINLVGVGAIFIDDIVQPDGTTHMGVLGGGVIHAMMGAAIWDERPGICALAGYDLPVMLHDFLRQYVDITGLHTLEVAQARAWQIFEYDGTRRELHRVQHIEPFIKGAQPEHLPAEYHQAQAFYFLQDFAGIWAWRKTQALKLWEPNQLAMDDPSRRDDMREVMCLSGVKVVSPNLLEAQLVYGETLTPHELLMAMIHDGAPSAVLRMGKQGALLMDARDELSYHVPTVPGVSVIDQTGAGNAFNGGMIVGLMRGKSLAESAAMGAVSASFCLERVGVIVPSHVSLFERDRRYQQVMDGIKQIDYSSQ
ncbi:MAG: hypothetical protein D6711_12595 [Chloroflexi bacterium]|nr:MAG: hypothetical protein D6711_12595 [Chloroflexota bacterium]